MKDYNLNISDYNENGELVETYERKLPSNWEEFQIEARRIWDLYTNDEVTNQTNIFEKLIDSSKSKSLEDFKFNINDEFIGDCDLYIDIKSDYGTSHVYFSSIENDMDILLWFLEALTFDNDEYYFVCSEEGPHTFFYVKKIDDESIRFIHISNKKQKAMFPLVTEPSFKILQDFIINKYTFISKIYNSLIYTIKNTKPNKINYWEVDVFEEMKKSSGIIEKYIAKIN